MMPDHDRSAVHAIRPAAPGDAPALADLFAALARETPYMPIDPRDPAPLRREAGVMLAAAALGRCGVFVASGGGGDGGPLLGYLDIHAPAPPPLAHAGFLAVGLREGARGRGLGTALIAAGEAWARSAGLLRVGLFVVAENAAAAALYLRLGYRFEGLRRAVYRLGDRLEDEYVMGKAL